MGPCPGYLSGAESRYTVIELFVVGYLQVQAVSGWSATIYPLIPILNTHLLDKIENPRLQCLKTIIMGYNFTAKGIKGALKNAPDILSSHPVTNPLPGGLHAERDIDNELGISIADIRAVLGAQLEELCGVCSY